MPRRHAAAAILPPYSAYATYCRIIFSFSLRFFFAAIELFAAVCRRRRAGCFLRRHSHSRRMDGLTDTADAGFRRFTFHAAAAVTDAAPPPLMSAIQLTPPATPAADAARPGAADAAMPSQR